MRNNFKVPVLQRIFCVIFASLIVRQLLSLSSMLQSLTEILKVIRLCLKFLELITQINTIEQAIGSAWHRYDTSFLTYFYATGPQPAAHWPCAGPQPLRNWAAEEMGKCVRYICEAVHRHTKQSTLPSYPAAAAAGLPKCKDWGMLFYATSHPFRITVVRNGYLWACVETLLTTAIYIQFRTSEIIQLRIFMRRQNILNKIFMLVLA